VDKINGGDGQINFFWSDPLGGAKNDYDLFVVNKKGQVIRSSTTSRSSQQDPFEWITIHQGESVAIVKATDSEPRFLHLGVEASDGGFVVLRYNTEGSVRGHNAAGAENAFSVAARKVPSPPTAFVSAPNDAVEAFSSDGPRRIFYNSDGTPITPGQFLSSGGRRLDKPDITAADGVSTSLLGFNPFNGTSAAAPHAAAIAALLLSCDPTLNPKAIRSALENSALALDGTVPNVTAGHGVVMSHTAAQKLCSTSPPTASAQPDSTTIRP
jgi:subtilisin family serine protease